MLRKSIPFIFRLGVCFILGVFLLTCAYSLSTEIIDRNVSNSFEIFEDEGTHPIVSTESTGYLDNYSDAVMLLEAANKNLDGATPLHEAMESSFSQLAEGNEMPKNDPNADLVGHYKDGKEFLGEVHYYRYWHGYLVFIKPLLMLTDYNGLRLLNGLSQLAITCIAVFLFAKKKGVLYSVAYLLLVISLRPFTSFLSLQYSSCFYVFSFASIALLFPKKLSNHKALFVFLYSGIATAFFDLLSYPLISFGIPAVVYLCLMDNSKLSNSILQIVKTGVAWLFGYVGMWGGKWIIGSLVLHRNIVRDGINSVLFRTSGEGFAIRDSIGANIGEFSKTPVFPIIMIFIISMFLLTALRLLLGNKRRTGILTLAKSELQLMIPFLIIAVSPLVWYAVLVNHSCIHFYLFANKIFSISMFSFMILAIGLYRDIRSKTNTSVKFSSFAQKIVGCLELPKICLIKD